jgi:hypothetical protein
MRLPLLIFLFVWAVSLKAQVNLVPNPSFEEYTFCPYNPGLIQNNLNWVNVLPSVDYYNECGTDGFGIPSSEDGYEYARTGQAYIGLLTTWSSHFTNAREFVGISLTDSLIVGKRYNVEFYVSLADSVWCATKNIGAYFSHGQPPSNTTTLLSYEAQIKYLGEQFLSEKVGWTKIQGSFMANGGENFITIGNFDNDANTDTLFVTGGVHLVPWPYAYYFIDDVSVTLDTTTGIAETEKPKLKIFPNPAGNQITIEQLSVSGNQLSVEIYDALGRLVLQSSINNQTSTIPLNLSKGVYLLRVKDKEEVVFGEKLIIE